MNINIAWFGELARRIRMFFHHDQFDRELDDEMRAHRELREQQLIEQGIAPDEAHYAAHRQLGNALRFREESREAWGWNWLEQSFQDVRYGLRILRKKPGFTIVAVLTLALGIGANTAIFSIINSIILRPLAFQEPQRLVRLYMYSAQREDLDATFPDLLDWRARNHSFQGLAATWQNDSSLFDQNGPAKIRSAITTANLFSTMGTQPIRGRAFRPVDDRVGYEHTVMISYGLWQTRYGGDLEILGKPITVDGTSYAIIGILPPGFQYPGKTDVWLPMGLGEEALIGFHDSRRIHAMETIGRLAQGTTLDHARVEMNVLADQLAKEYPVSNAGWSVRLVSLMDDTVGGSRKGLFVLMGAAGCVLLIACANLASLLLARGSARSKEFAVRSSLGGSRARLVRQITTESVVLGLLGGIAGVVLAYAAQAAILAMIPRDLPRLDEIRLDARAFAFAFTLALATSAFFGIAPALQNTKVNLQNALKAGGRQAGSDSTLFLRKFLVISEVACSLVLLIGATLLMESLIHLALVRPGFNPQNVITGTIGFPDSYVTQQQRANFAKKVIANLREAPGVRDAAGTSLLPLYNFKRQSAQAQIEGQSSDPNHAPESEITTITPEFFRAMQIPLVVGRGFTDADGGLSFGPIIINEAAARAFWPNQSPLGRRVRFEWIGTIVREVIGVVGDTRQTSLAVQPEPEIYLPLYGVASPYLTFIVRTDGNPAAFARVLGDEVHKVDGTLPVYDVQTLEQLMSESVNPNRFYLRLIGAFALVALALAAIGIYGLVSFNVAQRTQELGIRIALGAQPYSVLRMVLGQGLRLTIAGLLCGFVGAAALTQLIANLLFGVTPTDPLTLLGAGGLIVASATVASYIPARRAMRVDPIVALRYE